MATYKELMKQWEQAGKPRDVENIHQLLLDAGLDAEQASTAFQAAGHKAPQKAPELETTSDTPVEKTKPWEGIEVPKGYEVTSNSGVTFKFHGQMWSVTDPGNSGMRKGPVKKQYYDKLQAGAQQAIYKQRKSDEQKQQQDQQAYDSNFAFNDQTEDQMAFSSSQTAAQQKQNTSDPAMPETAQQSDEAIASLADTIKSHPQSKKISQLLTTGDPMAQKAAAILLQGNAKAVMQADQTLSAR